MGIFRQETIVPEYAKALLYTNGHHVQTVGPGRYLLWRFVTKQTATVVDMRQQSLTIAAQEILTKDRVPIRITLAATLKITDPVAASHQVQSWYDRIYLDLQLALREVVDDMPFDELWTKKRAIGDQVNQSVAPQAEQYGVELIRVAAKDITMPASIRDIMLKSVEAEKTAQASLIKAREEVAATRARANAAKLIADNPALLPPQGTRNPLRTRKITLLHNRLRPQHRP